MSFGSYLYRKAHRFKAKSTEDGYRYALQKLQEFWGEKPIKGLREEDGFKFVAWMVEQLSQDTCQSYLYRIREVWQWTARRGYGVEEANRTYNQMSGRDGSQGQSSTIAPQRHRNGGSLWPRPRARFSDLTISGNVGGAGLGSQGWGVFEKNTSTGQAARS
jgi:hypothetical protein